jgi:hypothetical protein
VNLKDSFRVLEIAQPMLAEINGVDICRGGKAVSDGLRN